MRSLPAFVLVGMAEDDGSGQQGKGAPKGSNLGP